jgi:excinuclease ABC subunit C
MRGDKVTLRVPSRGQGARLVKLALKNAENRLLREKHKSAVDRPLDRIAAKLRLPAPPHLIEGYDISNIAASEPVGVKVAFREGRPDKARYRKYKMEGFANQDDPGMIHRTLTRRLCHKDDDPLPDLLLVDGGKSQLNAAVAAVKEQLGNRGPAVAALAKGRGEREGDKLYLPNRKNPVTFPKGDPGLMLLMRVRDESHRFVHTFHSHSRKKAVIRSSLDEIRGIGPKKRQALLKAFGSVKQLFAATEEEIARIPGIGRRDAKRLRAHLEAKQAAESQETEPKDRPEIFPQESFS